MIDIKVSGFDLIGEDFINDLYEEKKTKILSDLSNMRCAIHGESPVFEGSGDSFSFIPCCDEFGSQVNAAIEAL